MEIEKKYISILLIVLAISPTISTNSYSTSTFERIDSYIQNDVMKRFLMYPGTSVAIVQDNETIYSKGYSQAGKNIQMTIDTPMILGSISKSFTALGIMQLNESGTLNPEDKIIEHIPWFSTKNSSAANEITVQHLLHHVSGFYNERSSEINQTLKEIVRECETDTLIASPG